MIEKRKVKNSEEQSRNILVLGLVVAIAVIVVAAFIFLQQQPTTGTLDYSAIPQNRTTDGAFVLGDPEAPVTIVAFEDFLCSHCQDYEPTLHAFMEQYVATGQAQFEFRMLPISQTSFVVFSLAECADILEPGSFWKARETLFGITTAQRFSDQSPREFARQMELSYDSILTCTQTASQWQTDMTLAGQYENITGTPSVGWRLDGGELRFSPLSARPSVEELGALALSMQNRTTDN